MAEATKRRINYFRFLVLCITRDTNRSLFSAISIHIFSKQYLSIAHMCRLREYSTTFFWQLRILKYTRYEMLNKALEAFGELRDDEELGPADWATVKKHITCLNDLDDDPEHPHDVDDKDDHVHTMNIRDIRVRLLNGILL